MSFRSWCGQPIMSKERSTATTTVAGPDGEIGYGGWIWRYDLASVADDTNRTHRDEELSPTRSAAS